MEVISPRDMRIADENASFLGLSRLLLMENAGRAVAEELARRLNGLRGRRVVVVAGLGNNGGDGMVAARHMASMGAEVCVILLGREEDIRTGEARANWSVLKNMFLTVKLRTARTPEELRSAWSELGAGEADAVVDAIFGTGIKGRIRSPYSDAIELINRASGARRPGLGLCMVMVRWALTVGSEGWPVSGSRPEGRSIEATRAFPEALLMSSMASE